MDGKIKCGVCNHTLTKRSFAKPTRHTAYFCRTSKTTDNYKCFQGKRKEAEMEETILTMLNNFVLMVDANRVSLSEEVFHSGEALRNLAILEKQLDSLKQSRLGNYELYKNEQVSKGVFIARKDDFERKMEDIHKEMKKTREQIEEHSKANQSDKPTIKDLKGFAPFEVLTRDIVERFIENMWIDENGKFNIKWTFSVPF